MAFAATAYCCHSSATGTIPVASASDRTHPDTRPVLQKLRQNPDFVSFLDAQARFLSPNFKMKRRWAQGVALLGLLVTLAIGIFLSALTVVVSIGASSATLKLPVFTLVSLSSSLFTDTLFDNASGLLYQFLSIWYAIPRSIFVDDVNWNDTGPVTHLRCLFIEDEDVPLWMYLNSRADFYPRWMRIALVELLTDQYFAQTVVVLLTFTLYTAVFGLYV